MRRIEVIAGTSGLGIPAGVDVIFCGPWIGELGVEVVRWTPYLRSIKAAHPATALVAGGYANSACLYQDFADEFWVLDETLRGTFLNHETSFNYAVFHEWRGNTGYRAHASRKGFPDTSASQRDISATWFRELERRNLRPATIVSELGPSRLHRRLTGSEQARAHARALLHKAANSPTDRVVMLLPRLRALQGEQRSWNPEFYLGVIARLEQLQGITIVVLGSEPHEAPLAALGDSAHRINLIGAGLDLQLALWEQAALGSGPPSGGLVPGYFTDTPLLHWYKPGQFPTRHGRPWHEVAERDYEVFGIRSEWIEVDGSDMSAARVAQAIATQLDCASQRPVAGAR